MKTRERGVLCFPSKVSPTGDRGRRPTGFWLRWQAPSQRIRIVAPMETTDRHGLLTNAQRMYLEALTRAESEDERERIDSAAGNALVKVFEQAGGMLASHLKDEAPRMLEEHRRLREEFEQGLRTYWGEALDALWSVYVAAMELGEEFNREQSCAAAEEQDFVFRALVGLHARACVTMSEIHALLRTGHSVGALARWRTLHECAVVSNLVGEHGRKPEYPDLAERYVLHDVIENEKDARDYQLHCAAIGYEPFSEEEMTELAQASAEVVRRFGTDYRENYGWAQPLFSRGHITFRDLEELVNLDHLRPYYRWANHGVHADSKGARLNLVNFRGSLMLMTGVTNAGLSDPGQSAAISLMQTTGALLIYGRPHIADVSDIPALHALQEMVNASCDLFAAAHDEL